MRPTGYYWIVFDYEGCFGQVMANQPRWEPAGWDEDAKGWSLLASTEIIPDDHWSIKQVGGPCLGQPSTLALELDGPSNEVIKKRDENT